MWPHLQKQDLCLFADLEHIDELKTSEMTLKKQLLLTTHLGKVLFLNNSESIILQGNDLLAENI